MAMTIKSAKKVAKRNWSLDKFGRAVKHAAKKAGIKKVSETRLKTCYDEGVTVRDTVEVLRGA